MESTILRQSIPLVLAWMNGLQTTPDFCYAIIDPYKYRYNKTKPVNVSYQVVFFDVKSAKIRSDRVHAQRKNTQLQYTICEHY